MSLESFKLMLAESLRTNQENMDYSQTLRSLRQFRSEVATGGVKLLSVDENDSLITNLFAFVEKMHLVQPPSPDSTLAFSIGVQCIVNLMSNNDAIRNYFADNYIQSILGWLKTEGCKQQNYVCAALLNIDQVGKLSKELNNEEFVRDLISVSESGAEFGILLMQNLLNSRHFRQLYEAAREEQRFFLVQLLESMMTDEGSFVDEVTFLSSKFKKSCDGIMAATPSVSSFASLELALMLEFLSATSYKSGYISTLQSDFSLVINSSYLLRGIHEIVSQKKTWKESLKEAVESIKDKNSELTKKPFFGVKGNLIRLLGNLSYKHKRNQDQIREAGCIPIFLDSCKLDGENPFIKEWSILTIRNVCDGNPENQTFIKNMNYQGCDLSVVQELSLSLDDGEGNGINIAPVLRRC
uniref:Ataxin-10 n=1 Tax=Lygus hesperus TaxID=30085 RepID=A0A0K8T3G0_LYGHE